MPGEFELQDWGRRAYVDYNTAIQTVSPSVQMAISSPSGTAEDLNSVMQEFKSARGHFCEKFKLLLAPDRHYSTKSMFAPLPNGLSVQRVVTDYLHQISTFIIVELKKKFGSHILKRDIQWCLSVPKIWDDEAKNLMVHCAEIAGLVQGPQCRDQEASLHPIRIVLEPEAAGFYCLQKFKDRILNEGSKFFVVDVGGETVNLVIHQKIGDSGMTVKELTCSSGDLCGGTFVDKAFIKFLGRKIDCLTKLNWRYPSTMLTIQGYWENLKRGFDGKQRPCDLELPAKLARAWQEFERRAGVWAEDKLRRNSDHRGGHEKHFRWRGG